ncbi:Dynactin subunit 4 [Bagarius yarrelli]|uniref:Dynactin subunit 4 n=1 Tax=Bagarius yarrelli TaxID=175774 RepID=A0A556V4W8_BAGYA|nr:Dynactin subunit 4 [Bagarius yarrelli]
MASLLQPDRVVYLVRGEKKIRSPLSQLYFCRYCSELRSLECVSHERATNHPAPATNIPAPLPDDPTKTTMKKTYYLACGFCRWSSRDVGMADKSVGEELLFLRVTRDGHVTINKLIEYYQQLAQREKLDRDRKKLARRRPFMPQAFSEKYGLGTRLQRQRPGGAPISALYGLSLKEGEEQKEVSIEPAQALDEVEPLPDDYYTRPVNLTEGKDAAAEYDELAEPQDFQDDPDVVAFRKSNKIGFFIKVIPQHENGDVTVSFKMRHDFRNLAAPIRTSEEEPAVELIWLTHHVELSLGPLAA